MRRGGCRVALGSGLLAAALVVAPVSGATADDSVVQFEVVDSASSGDLSLEVHSLTRLGPDGELYRYLLRMTLRGQGTLVVRSAGEVLATRGIDNAAGPSSVEVEIALRTGENLVEIEFVSADGLAAETADIEVSVPAEPSEQTVAAPTVVDEARDGHDPLALTGTEPSWAAALLGAALALLGLGVHSRRRRAGSAHHTPDMWEERPMA